MAASPSCALLREQLLHAPGEAVYVAELDCTVERTVHAAVGASVGGDGGVAVTGEVPSSSSFDGACDALRQLAPWVPAGACTVSATDGCPALAQAALHDGALAALLPLDAVTDGVVDAHGRQPLRPAFTLTSASGGCATPDNVTAGGTFFALAERAGDAVPADPVRALLTARRRQLLPDDDPSAPRSWAAQSLDVVIAPAADDSLTGHALLPRVRVLVAETAAHDGGGALAPASDGVADIVRFSIDGFPSCELPLNRPEGASAVFPFTDVAALCSLTDDARAAAAALSARFAVRAQGLMNAWLGGALSSSTRRDGTEAEPSSLPPVPNTLTPALLTGGADGLRVSGAPAAPAAGATVCRAADSLSFHRPLTYDVTASITVPPTRGGGRAGGDVAAPPPRCHLALSQRLSTGTYFDVDEMRARVRAQSAAGATVTDFVSFSPFIDVERPSFESRQHVVLLSVPLSDAAAAGGGSDGAPGSGDDFGTISTRPAAGVPGGGTVVTVRARVHQLLHVRYPRPGCDGPPVEAAPVAVPGGGTVQAYADGSFYFTAPTGSFGLTGPSASYAAATNASAPDGGWPYISGCYVRPRLPLPAVALRCDDASSDGGAAGAGEAALPSQLLARGLYGAPHAAGAAAGGWVDVPVGAAATAPAGWAACAPPLYPVGTPPVSQGLPVTIITAAATLLAALLVVVVTLRWHPAGAKRPSEGKAKSE